MVSRNMLSKAENVEDSVENISILPKKSTYSVPKSFHPL